MFLKSIIDWYTALLFQIAMFWLWTQSKEPGLFVGTVSSIGKHQLESAEAADCHLNPIELK